MDKALEAIGQLLHRAASKGSPFPPTLLFEEGWMLRLVLQWFEKNETTGHDLTFAPSARWFSEARLASPFPPQKWGDKRGEGYTSADGVIGHIAINQTKKAELNLADDARQLIVVEAKMFSGLSKGTTHAKKYNQAARNVACIASLVIPDGRDGSDMPSVAFFVLAPREQIDAGVFAKLMNKPSLEDVVRKRVKMYDPSKKKWFKNRFLPTLNAMRVDCLAWEDVVAFITAADRPFGADLEAFYNCCLEHNRPANRSKRP